MLLQAPINSLGYGVAGYNIAKQLAKRIKLTNDFTIFPISQPESELYEELAQYDWRNKEEINWNEDCIKIWHQNGLHESVGKRKKIGFPIFELNKFTQEEKISMKSCDHLFVCSKWAQGVVEDQIGTSPSIVPLGVDRSLFNESNNMSRKSTIFFNCGKWETRKGHDIIKKCFEKAFSQNDDVELWMMCENPFLGEKNNDWIDYYRSCSIANKIRFIPRQKYHRDVYNIMRQVDAGVFPVRAEGWNLELLELLSCGKHVITTDYSGHTEFTNSNNSYIVNTDKLVQAQDGIWFHGQGEWADLDKEQEDQIINHMKEIHKLKRDNKLELNSAGVETAINFSWENTVKEILNGI